VLPEPARDNCLAEAGARKTRQMAYAYDSAGGQTRVRGA
jgi:hypothetical protein